MHYEEEYDLALFPQLNKTAPSKKNLLYYLFSTKAKNFEKNKLQKCNGYFASFFVAYEVLY